MKKIFILSTVLVFLSSIIAFGQNNLGKSDDLARIALNIYVPKQTEPVSDIVSKSLEDKLTQMLLKHSLSGDNSTGRFIVVPLINILGKEVTASAPAMTVIELQLSLYIGDGVSGIKFASASLSAKGVGQNETKAYIDALKRINVNDPAIRAFVENGKMKIIEYYNSNCDNIIADAQSFSGQNNLQEGIFILNQVPDVCKDCYLKASKLAVEFYKKQQERNCKIKLSQAQNIWSSNPTESGAEEACKLLNEIDPETTCYSYAEPLIEKINSRIIKKIEANEAYERKLEAMRMKNEFALEKARIEAVRAEALAYAKSRPTTVIYNVKGWW